MNNVRKKEKRKKESKRKETKKRKEEKKEGLLECQSSVLVTKNEIMDRGGRVQMNLLKRYQGREVNLPSARKGI